MSGRKHRPCLRCDKPHLSTPETRICKHCKHAAEGYQSYKTALEGIALTPTNKTLFNIPKYTRSVNE